MRANIRPCTLAAVDSAYDVDLDALLRAVRTNDHLIVRFSTIGQRLFLDYRTSETEGPGAFLLPAANSMGDRLSSIAAVRPNFPRPERLAVIAWPLRVGSLGRLGFIEAARQRLAAMDAFDAVRDLDATYSRLLGAEREEIRRAITGDQYQTIWRGTSR